MCYLYEVCKTDARRILRNVALAHFLTVPKPFTEAIGQCSSIPGFGSKIYCTLLSCCKLHL